MIEGIEWLFIGIIVLLLIFYEPQKITQLTKALAQAKKEYEKASSTLVEQIERESGGTEETQSQQSKPMHEHEQESADVHIIKFAKMFNIQTYGKTLDEIRAEISKKASEYFFGNKQIQLQPMMPDQQTTSDDSINKDSSSQTSGDGLENKKSE